MSSEITPESVYLQRRQFLKTAAAAGAVMMSGQACSREIAEANAAETGSVVAQSFEDRFGSVQTSKFSTDEKMNSWKDITTYNNFYEFGLDKADPAEHAHTLVTDPWSVKVSGEADVQGTFTLEDILQPHDFEERIYRLRCVEAWSMVIPWIGIPLGDVLKRFKPNSNAKYVEFRTLKDAKQMPGQRRRVLDWPYREGLRIDEAMNPLAILAVGLYGKVMPNQNGAPLRLVVPWKYGFKSIKSIVSIKFTKRMPSTSWEMSAPNEYGFFANVNPQVDHPRWSQARERPIGEGLFARKKPTLMFNGYADEVADLYDGMDLRKNF